MTKEMTKTKQIVKTSQDLSVCIHCRKEIVGKATLSGLAFICPYCGRPTGNGTPGTGYKWGAANNMDFHPNKSKSGESKISQRKTSLKELFGSVKLSKPT